MFFRFLGIAFLKNLALFLSVVFLLEILLIGPGRVYEVGFLVSVFFVDVILSALFTEWAFSGSIPSRKTTMHLASVWLFTSLCLMLVWAMQYAETFWFIRQPYLVAIFIVDLSVIGLLSMRLRRHAVESSVADDGVSSRSH